MKTLYCLIATLRPAFPNLVNRIAIPSIVAAAALALVQPCVGLSFEFRETGSLAMVHDVAPATLLPNGQVLIAGGEDENFDPIAGAELYNPTSGTWSATASLPAARAAHSATLLPNGQVLVAGGVDSDHGVAIAVGITADGQLGVKASSVRFKEAIRPMNKASETILSLRPVTFRYKKNLDPKGTPQFGLVAEEVAKVDPDLVARDEKGKPFTVRYEEINAMLLNEFLKEHRKVEEQSCQIANQDCKVEKLEATVAQQQKDFQSAIAEQRRANEALTATVKAQAAQIQKVSDQLTTQAPVPRVVANN